MMIQICLVYCSIATKLSKKGEKKEKKLSQNSHKWTAEEIAEVRQVYKASFTACKTPGQATLIQGITQSKQRGGGFGNSLQTILKKKYRG